MPTEVNPKETSRAMAFELWMQAPNPMVTFFKTLDVTCPVRLSKRKGLKFNTLQKKQINTDCETFSKKQDVWGEN